jgi:hypothetical protein
VTLGEKMRAKRYGQECRHPDCHGEPYGRVTTPFGEGVFCEKHTEVATAWEANQPETRPSWIIDAFRYGPGRDPELEPTERREMAP